MRIEAMSEPPSLLPIKWSNLKVVLDFRNDPFVNLNSLKNFTQAMAQWI